MAQRQVAGRAVAVLRALCRPKQVHGRFGQVPGPLRGDEDDGGGAVAKDLAGQQIMASVNNPAEAKGFYENGDVVPLIAFSDERLPNLPDVRTVKELDKDFSYYNQRAVVGAPGMSEEAAEYYRNLFQTIYDTEDWQNYMASESLEALPMDADAQREYWSTQVTNHEVLLKAMGE